MNMAAKAGVQYVTMPTTKCMIISDSNMFILFAG